MILPTPPTDSLAEDSAAAASSPAKPDAATMDSIARRLLARVNEELPTVIQELVKGGFDPTTESLQLECRLVASTARLPARRVRAATLRIDHCGASRAPVFAPTPVSPSTTSAATPTPRPGPPEHTLSSSSTATTASTASDLSSIDRPRRSLATSTGTSSEDAEVADEDAPRPLKRRKEVGSLRVSLADPSGHDGNGEDDAVAVRRIGSQRRTFPQRRKRTPDNPALQPSTLEKFIGGVWDSLYSGVAMDPANVIEQWQAIESSGQTKLITDTEREVAMRNDSSNFARMNVLTRKISQTSRTCRSLEVIVQARWIQCFDERVAELARRDAGEKAKKTAVAEACLDFHWTEKELRNKIGVWRGYHDIQQAGGWAVLVFAGMGLYRFCKYRVSFSDEAFQTLRALRHRFEVAADTLHPRWRALLGIVGAPTSPLYSGHPHDWVVNGAGHTALPLPITYHQWDKSFSYTHLDASELDPDVWGDFDPRTAVEASDPRASHCASCGARQSDDPRLNACVCFPVLYGSTRAGAIPVQIFRTPNGKNNGLLACCAFERGAAVGEFIGLITAGIDGLDVMIGQTDRAAYQIWQGKAGNHTRFVNHSCQPNSQFERFVWLGTQRIVLVSKGIAAGEEITVDYSDTYWRNLDKKCLCERPACRYRNREAARLLFPSPPTDDDERDRRRDQERDLEKGGREV